MKKFLVIGSPIDHSLSPELHNFWIKKNNLKADYQKYKIKKKTKDVLLKVKNLKRYGKKNSY